MSEQLGLLDDQAEVAQLRAELADAHAEMTRLRDQGSRMLRDRTQFERDVRAATRRTAQEDWRLWSDFYFRHEIDEAWQPITGIIYRVGQLPDRPGKKMVEDLRRAATHADAVLQVARARSSRDPDYGVRVRAEVNRLRSYVTGRGQAFHAAAVATGMADGRCGCVGCELIRGMDDVS